MKTLGLIALIIILVTTVRWFVLAFRVAIPSYRTPYAIAWGAGAVLGIVALVFGGGAAAGWATALGLLFTYLIHTGDQSTGTGKITVGDTIPAFTATTDSGEAFDSAELAGKPALLKFFRGHW